MNTNIQRSSVVSALIGGASFFILIFGMQASASILTPVFLALIMAISITPLTRWFVRKGLSKGLALIVTLVIMILLIVGFVALMGVAIGQLIVTLPTYEGGLDQVETELESIIANLGIDISTIQAQDNFNPSGLIGFFGSLLQSVAGALSSIVVMLMILIFMLIDTSSFGDRFRSGYTPNSPMVIRVNKFTSDIRHYVTITTQINFAVGVVDTIFLLILGVDFAVLWGILAFLLGYIPSVGFWLALIPPFFLALAEFGITRALIVLVGFVLINGSVQNFLQPKLMGKGLNLSPLVVVVSLIFWAWILGPIGALLAVPLTMVVKDVFLESFEETRGLAMLMGGGDGSVDDDSDAPSNLSRLQGE